MNLVGATLNQRTMCLKGGASLGARLKKRLTLNV